MSIFAIPGIYVIINKRNGKQYVGQSLNMRQRWSLHINMLRRGKGSRKIQKDFNKYGEDAFTFQTLERCVSPHMLDERETAWIEQLNTVEDGYNFPTLMMCEKRR